MLDISSDVERQLPKSLNQDSVPNNQNSHLPKIASLLLRLLPQKRWAAQRFLQLRALSVQAERKKSEHLKSELGD